MVTKSVMRTVGGKVCLRMRYDFVLYNELGQWTYFDHTWFKVRRHDAICIIVLCGILYKYFLLGLRIAQPSTIFVYAMFIVIIEKAVVM